VQSEGVMAYSAAKSPADPPEAVTTEEPAIFKATYAPAAIPPAPRTAAAAIPTEAPTDNGG